MKLFLCCAVFFASALPAHAQLDRILKGLGSAAKTAVVNDQNVVSGLKEALQIGTENSVNTTSKKDGFFRDEIIHTVGACGRARSSSMRVGRRGERVLR